MISGIIKVSASVISRGQRPRLEAEADYTCLDLDYSRYHKNLIKYYYCLEIIPITRNFSAAKTGAGKMKAVIAIEEWY